MAADDDLYAVQVPGHVIPVVGHQKGNAGDLKAENGGQVPQAILPQIIIAAHGIDGSAQAELIQVHFLHDIPGMEDMGTVLELRYNLPAEQPVTVGQNRHINRVHMSSFKRHFSGIIWMRRGAVNAKPGSGLFGLFRCRAACLVFRPVPVLRPGVLRLTPVRLCGRSFSAAHRKRPDR